MNNKYKNNKFNGFDSKKEFRRYEELKRMQDRGEITDLQCQVRFVLIPSQKICGKVVERAVTYIADFTYFYNGSFVVEDVKSAYTRKLSSYIIKRKLMLYIHNIKIQEYK